MKLKNLKKEKLIPHGCVHVDETNFESSTLDNSDALNLADLKALILAHDPDH